MKDKQIRERLETLGIPVAYHHFEEDPEKIPPEPPFLVYHYPQTANCFADNRVYEKKDILTVELYADKKDFELEQKLEELLDGAGLCWEKEEVWIESEKMYEEIYKMEVMIDGEKQD